MVDRIEPVEAVSAIGRVAEADVYRTNKIPAAQTNGIVDLRRAHRPADHHEQRGGAAGPG